MEKSAMNQRLKFTRLQVRLPEKINEDIQEDPSGKSMFDRGWLNGASQKVGRKSIK